MPTFFKPNLDKQEYSHMSLMDMVNKIKEKPDFFEGNSYIIINKIREIKNKGDSGWREINDAWSIYSQGESKRKIDKYFHKGLEVDSDLSINKSVKINFSDERTIPQPIRIKDKEISSTKNKGECHNFSVNVVGKFK